MQEDEAEGADSFTMAVALYGVLREYPWIGQVTADHDLDEDLFSLAVKRAAAYGFSSTRLSAGAELGGQRWGHADAGGDWSQDGQVRELASLTVYPATGLRAQHLPVLPMTRVLADALNRVGEVDFRGLSTAVPMHLAPDTQFDLVGEAAWYALAAPDSRTRATVTVTVTEAAAAKEVCELTRERGHDLLRVEPASQNERLPVLRGIGHDLESPRLSAFTCDVPEWTPEAAAWLAEVFIDSLRCVGAGPIAGIEIALPGTTLANGG
ncbi:hypothetical protein AB0J21_08765 [Streptomyces sp. NPDC049954]|uniref:hypothetical protein n=1 Tax=Streptomyces sp. NPDC049954 TaxID=3155779 RepID=UPI00342484A5